MPHDRKLSPEERLAAALALPTITREFADTDTTGAFQTFRQHLIAWFPKTHAALSRAELPPRGALHYVWQGTDATARPWLFIAHQDVVAAPDGPDTPWTHPPFGGVIADGHVWGRGAIDLKVSMMAMMEAIETLLAEGYPLRRTLHLAFGADEESGGSDGAALIAEALRARNIRFVFSLDEGGLVTRGAVPGTDRALAMIGIAEKGYLTLRLTATGPGGHSSMPGAAAPVERLIALLAAVRTAMPPASLDGPMLQTLGAVAPVTRRPHRWAYRHARYLAPLVRRAIGGSPTGAASVRSTLAVTELSAGTGENVIPAVAAAVLNYRLMPGDPAAAIIEEVVRLARAHGAEVEVLARHDPSSVSNPQSAAYAALTEAITAAMPDVVPVPYLSLNSTDSRHFEGLVDDQYRFLPVRLDADALDMIHGANERIAVSGYHEMIAVYREVIRHADRMTG